VNECETLLKPSECVILLVDLQAGLGFGMESMPRQVLLNNAVAFAKAATAFGVPVIATTSASKVYSGPLFPQVQEGLLEVKAIERRGSSDGGLCLVSGAISGQGGIRSVCRGRRLRWTDTGQS